MPRYRFHLHEPDRSERDDDGIECVDVLSARRRAVQMARDIMAGSVMDGALHLGSTIEIENEAGDVEARLVFADAIAITR